MTTGLPTPPIRSPISDADGNITVPWTTWFTNIFSNNRVVASGTFLSADAKTVTVENGVIVSIV